MASHSDKLANQHKSNKLLISEIELWKTELRFFDRVLHKQDFIGSGEDTQIEMQNLESRQLVLVNELRNCEELVDAHEKYLSNIISGKTEYDVEDFDLQDRDAINASNHFEVQFKIYKKDLFWFLERIVEFL